jgi:OOP family OmpA-OmpF porin
MLLPVPVRIAIGGLALAVAGCANPPIHANKAVCMAVGAGLGAGGGLVIENNDHHGEDHHRTGSALVGALVGGALGYALCGQPEPPKPAPEPEARPTPPPPPPPAPAPRRIVLRGVNFDFDRAEIRPDAAVILDEAASILNENTGVRVEVSGHTDATGTDEYNQGLSERRARSVADYLSSKGVSADRLDTAGYGESKPVADNATRDGRAQNRRVELNVAQ